LKKSILVFLFVSLAFAQRWQTTSGDFSSGLCRIDSLKVRVNVHPLYIEIEEEAVITPRGVEVGDSKKLEINGSFKMSTFRTISSFNFWENDNKIEAKLKTKNDARMTFDTAMKLIEDTQSKNVISRAPAIITYENDTTNFGSYATYSFRIYPAQINKGRKIRIIHTTGHDYGFKYMDMISYRIGSIFAEFLGDELIPITIITDNFQNKQYSFYNDASPLDNDIIKSDSTYLLNLGKASLLAGGGRIELKMVDTPGTFGFHSALQIRDTIFHFYGTHLTIPDTITALKNTTVYKNVIAEIVFNDTTLMIPIFEQNGISKFFKIKEIWDRKVNWILFNKDNGDTLIQIPEIVPIVSDSSNSTMIPIIWATELRHFVISGGFDEYLLFPYGIEKDSSYGTSIGYLDRDLSLLALNETKVQNIPKKLHCAHISNRMKIIGNNQLLLILNKPVLEEEYLFSIYSLDGKLVYKKCCLNSTGEYVTVNYPSYLKGIYTCVLSNRNTILKSKLLFI
jgi:hypothetical protein